MSPQPVPIDPIRFEAAVFDLDGVLTETAEIHAQAWKRLFDEFLQKQAAGKPFQPFDAKSDYLAYVDGRPRGDGAVRSSGPAPETAASRPELTGWCRLGDSNTRPTHYECAALPAELRRA